jgi:ribosomal protein S6--L-glutamate ligase
MRIAILSRNSNLYSTRRLRAAAIARGHRVKVIDILKCSMNITSRNPSIHYEGSRLGMFDAIIPRIGATYTFYGSAVVRHFETMGTFSLNPSIAITRSRDKLRSLQLLGRKGVGMPVTEVAHAYSDVEDLISMVGGAPLVIKVIEGTQGVGVVLAETQKAAQSVIQAFIGFKANIIIQEYIKEAHGTDIRCLVVGNKVVAVMKREGPPGEFRSNIHRGGSGANIKIEKMERETAVMAARILGLHFAGVDLLRSARGPLVLEVNSSPGLEGIEKVTGKDIASQVIEYIEKYAKPITTRSHYQG